MDFGTAFCFWRVLLGVDFEVILHDGIGGGGGGVGGGAGGGGSAGVGALVFGDSEIV